MTTFRRTASEALFTSPWITLSRHALATEDGVAISHPVYTLDMGDWVNIIALTASREVVFVSQHRFGVQAQSLEIPGGMIDAGEDPAHAAARELREETGYTARSWRMLGWTHPNPAMQGNRLYTFVAEGCERTEEIELDTLEDCAVELVPYATLPALLARGGVRHALVLLALYELLLEERGLTVAAP